MNNLQLAFDDNPWPTELKNHNYMTHLLHQAKYLLGTNIVDQYSLVETSHKKGPKNESDPNDYEYELLILKYDANQDKLV